MTPKQLKKLDKFVQGTIPVVNQVETPMNVVSPFDIGVNMGIAAATNGILKTLGEKSLEKYYARLSRAVEKQTKFIRRYYLLRERSKPSRSSR